jgi:hypothetical protein
VCFYFNIEHSLFNIQNLKQGTTNDEQRTRNNLRGTIYEVRIRFQKLFQ